MSPRTIAAPTTFAARAETITQYGIPVIPIPPRTKEAVLKNWPSLATTDEAQIAEWDRENPEYNCAAVGRTKEFWFIDADRFVGLSERIKQETGYNLDSIDTLMVQSSEGKMHIYFKHDACSEAIGNFSVDDKDGEVFSIRAHNAYVVAPGSIHPKTGLPYEIITKPVFGEVPTAPDWLLDWLKTAKRLSVSQKAKIAADNEAKIPEGGRDEFLFAEACKLRDTKVSQKAALAALLVVNSDRCVPPMAESDVKIKITSAYKRDARVKPANGEAAPKGKTQTPPEKSVGAPPVGDIEEYEPASTSVSEYPAMGNDLISQWARLATSGTGIPYGHVREDLKLVLAFCLSDTIRYPGHETLYPRGWHFNIGDAESGKTTALVFVLDRWRGVMHDLGIRLDKLSSYGSLQFLTKGFEDHPRMFLYVTEGNTLANANEHIAAIFGGLSDLYDQSIISAGSYKNKSAVCTTAQGSSVLCFTPDDYLKALEGKGVIGGGVLPRWTMSESKKIIVAGDWVTPPEVELRDLQNQMLERFNDVRVIETAEAKTIREALKIEMDQPEAGRHGKRLIEHFKRECLLAAVFASAGVLNQNVGIITKEIAEWAAQWVRYQLHLRIALWPIDAGSDVERMCSLMRALLQRANPKAVSLKQLKDTCNVYRQGSGGIEAFGRAYRAMIMNEEMRKAGKNSRGKDLFGLVAD